MPISLRTLLQDRSLGLRLLVEGDDDPRPVRWVHSSDVDDPTPFLEPGVVLLTTWLVTLDAAATDAYVRRLREAQVTALGFGYDSTGRLDSCPPELISAARRHGLPLFEVPVETPFIAVMRVAAAAATASEYAQATAVHRAAQDLTRAAAVGHVPVLLRLSHSLQGWAALIDSQGDVVHAAPESAGPLVAPLSADLERLRENGPRSSVSVTVDGEHIVLYPLGLDQARGFLAAGRRAPWDPPALSLVDTAVSVLTIRLSRDRSQRLAERQAYSATLDLLLAGHDEDAQRIMTHLTSRLPSSPLRLHLLRAPAGADEELERACALAAARGREGHLAAERDGTLVVLAQCDGQLETELPKVAARLKALLGSSAPHDRSELRRALSEAQAALDSARAPDRTIVNYETVSRGRILDLLEHDLVMEWARSVLQPVLAQGPQALAALSAFLRHGGVLQEAAAELDVHRNTLRNRLQRLQKGLEHDLSSPSDCAELLLAVQAWINAKPER
ncbi:PucR family transcriptional regulator [Streptomyces pathocidini]|uniref:PucR family transcriptional regulator n=1 Tax=Streptomyces pathocidini TaxID=1650571 RepID=UPI0033F0BC5D